MFGIILMLQHRQKQKGEQRSSLFSCSWSADDVVDSSVRWQSSCISVQGNMDNAMMNSAKNSEIAFMKHKSIRKSWFGDTNTKNQNVISSKHIEMSEEKSEN